MLALAVTMVGCCAGSEEMTAIGFFGKIMLTIWGYLDKYAPQHFKRLYKGLNKNAKPSSS